MSRLIAVFKSLILKGTGGEAATAPSVPANAIVSNSTSDTIVSNSTSDIITGNT